MAALCCSSQKAAPVGTINVLVGSDLHDVSAQLANGLGGAVKLAESQRYLPGSTVPFPENFGERKLDYFVKTAISTASQGGNVVLSMEDPTNSKMMRLRTLLSGSNLQINTALVYPPATLPNLNQSADKLQSAVTSFASLWTGESAPSRSTVAQIPVSTATKFLSKLSGAFGSTSSDAGVLSKIASQHMAHALGLHQREGKSGSTIYLKPRFSNYDMIVPSNHRASKTLQKEIHDRYVYNSRSNMFVKPGVQASSELCSSCQSSRGQHLCGICTPKSLRNIAAPAGLRGSNMQALQWSNSPRLSGTNMGTSDQKVAIAANDTCWMKVNGRADSNKNSSRGKKQYVKDKNDTDEDQNGDYITKGQKNLYTFECDRGNSDYGGLLVHGSGENNFVSGGAGWLVTDQEPEDGWDTDIDFDTTGWVAPTVQQESTLTNKQKEHLGNNRFKNSGCKYIWIGDQKTQSKNSRADKMWARIVLLGDQPSDGGNGPETRECYCDGWGDVHFNSPCSWNGNRNYHPRPEDDPYLFARAGNVEIRSKTWSCAPGSHVTCHDEVEIIFTNGSNKKVVGLLKSRLTPKMDNNGTEEGIILGQEQTIGSGDKAVKMTIKEEKLGKQYMFEFEQAGGFTKLRAKKGHWSKHNADYVNLYLWNSPRGTPPDHFLGGFCFPDTPDPPEEPDDPCKAEDVTDELRAAAKAHCAYIPDAGYRESCEQDYCAEDGPPDEPDPEVPEWPFEKCQFTLKNDTGSAQQLNNFGRQPFWVKGQKDAYIYITAEVPQNFTKDSDKTYKIKLGSDNGKKIEIYREGSKKETCGEFNWGKVTEKDEYKKYWFSWANGKIGVGRDGTDAPDCEYTDGSPFDVIGFAFGAGNKEIDFRLPGGDCDPPPPPRQECYCEGWGDVHFKSPCVWPGNKNYHPEGNYVFAEFDKVKVHGKGYKCAGDAKKVTCHAKVWIELEGQNVIIDGFLKDSTPTPSINGTPFDVSTTYEKTNGTIKWTCRKENDKTYFFTFDQPNGFTKLRVKKGRWNKHNADYYNLYVWNTPKNDNQQLDGYCFNPNAPPEPPYNPCEDDDVTDAVRQQAYENCKKYLDPGNRQACEEDYCAIPEEPEPDPEWPFSPCEYDLNANKCGGVQAAPTGYFMKFWIKAQKETSVFLTSDTDENFSKNFNSYEIAIGGSNGKKITMKKNGAVKATKDNISGLLNNSEEKQFWLTFVPGIIRIGRGQPNDNYDNYELQMTDANPIDIKGFNFCTGSAKGYFRLPGVDCEPEEPCSECPAPPGIQNGSINKPSAGQAPGSTVKYSCNNCYILQGGANKKCNETTCQWPSPPTCVPDPACNDPPDECIPTPQNIPTPPNGEHTCPGTGSKCVAWIPEFSCPSGKWQFKGWQENDVTCANAPGMNGGDIGATIASQQ